MRYFTYFTKLTDYHVIPSKIRKMKVSCCTQVFSQRVGRFMQCLIDSGLPVLSTEASHTASLFLFLDQLFDSCNGVKKYAESGHTLRCRITADSPHHKFWTEAKTILHSMRYESKVSKQTSKPPSIENWIRTIDGLEYLWRKFSSLGFTFMIPRRFNQDAIENFFCCIRSYGVRNINHTCDGFINAFKTLTINNLFSSKSVNSNCENDISEKLFDNFREFLKQTPVSRPSVPNINLTIDVIHKPVHVYIENYVGGCIARKLHKKVGKCDTCIKNLLATSEGEQHKLIIARQYDRKSLMLPSTLFMNIFHECSVLVSQEIVKKCL